GGGGWGDVRGGGGGGGVRTTAAQPGEGELTGGPRASPPPDSRPGRERPEAGAPEVASEDGSRALVRQMTEPGGEEAVGEPRPVVMRGAPAPRRSLGVATHSRCVPRGAPQIGRAHV